MLTIKGAKGYNFCGWRLGGQTWKKAKGLGVKQWGPCPCYIPVIQNPLEMAFPTFSGFANGKGGVLKLQFRLTPLPSLLNQPLSHDQWMTNCNHRCSKLTLKQHLGPKCREFWWRGKYPSISASQPSTNFAGSPKAFLSLLMEFSQNHLHARDSLSSYPCKSILWKSLLQGLFLSLFKKKCVMLGIEPGALYKLNKCFTTKRQPQIRFSFPVGIGSC